MILISKGNVKHDGKWYTDGEKMGRMKKEEGERLIDLGVAFESDKEDENTPTPPAITTVIPDGENDEDDEDDEDEDEEEEEEETPTLTKAQIRAANRKKK